MEIPTTEFFEKIVKTGKEEELRSANKIVTTQYTYRTLIIDKEVGMRTWYLFRSKEMKPYFIFKSECDGSSIWT